MSQMCQKSQMGLTGQMCQKGQIGQTGQGLVYVKGLGLIRFDSVKILSGKSDMTARWLVGRVVGFYQV